MKTPRNLLYNNLYRIPTARMNSQEYDGGAYFVTICTKKRAYHFGEIKSDIHGTKCMILSDIGRHTDDQIRNISTHCPYANVPLWVVMPNHIHMIVLIDGNMTPHPKRTSNPAVETFHETSPKNHETAPEAMEYVTQMQSWLSVVIRLFKSSITQFARISNIPFAWQSRFHDHIIRDTDDMNRIADYISHNVQRWDDDCFNA